MDENDASQIAALLSFLRLLQRQFQLAVVVVHHARKDSGSSRPGQALLGSSELHGWGDSNLYMRRRGEQLTLCTEHRAAASQDHIPLTLALQNSGPSLALSNPEQSSASLPPRNSPAERIQKILAASKQPMPLQPLRKLCGLRTASVCSALAELCALGIVTHDAAGYRLNSDPVSLSRPLGPQGNGNGKH